ncbi:hypothetical protein INR49_002677 [Caranx melampygus]|nr:hypothetical protein INR49_002677 [Caranx melampygus]
MLPGEDEPLHALVTANTMENVKKAVEQIRNILKQGIETPEDQNDLRKMQLRELARLNGTLREDDNRILRPWQNSEPRSITNTTLCTKCGGAGHISSDCKYTSTFAAHRATGGEPPQSAQDKARMDKEYLSLMAELGEAPVPTSGEDTPAPREERRGPRAPTTTTSLHRPLLPPWARVQDLTDIRWVRTDALCPQVDVRPHVPQLHDDGCVSSDITRTFFRRSAASSDGNDATSTSSPQQSAASPSLRSPAAMATTGSTSSSNQQYGYQYTVALATKVNLHLPPPPPLADTTTTSSPGTGTLPPWQQPQQPAASGAQPPPPMGTPSMVPPPPGVQPPLPPGAPPPPPPPPPGSTGMMYAPPPPPPPMDPSNFVTMMGMGVPGMPPFGMPPAPPPPPPQN